MTGTAAKVWDMSLSGRRLRDRRQNPEMGDHLVMGEGGSIRSQRETAHRVQRCSRVFGEPDVDKVRVRWDGFELRKHSACGCRGRPYVFEM